MGGRITKKSTHTHTHKHKHTSSKRFSAFRGRPALFVAFMAFVAGAGAPAEAGTWAAAGAVVPVPAAMSCATAAATS